MTITEHNVTASVVTPPLTFDQIVSRFPGAHSAQGWASAPCPLADAEHSGRDLFLEYVAGEDGAPGRVDLRCLAGCTEPADEWETDETDPAGGWKTGRTVPAVGDVLEAVGLDVDALDVVGAPGPCAAVEDVLPLPTGPEPGRDVLSPSVRAAVERKPLPGAPSFTWDDVVKAMAPALALAPVAAPAVETGSEDEGKALSPADLVRMVMADYRIGRSTDGLLFAVPTWAGALPLASPISGLGSTVRRRVFEATGKVPGRETIAGALDTVAAYAETAEPETVHLRAAHVGGVVWLDLGDVEGRLVKVTGDGWTVVVADAGAPLFRRGNVTQALPVPTHGDPDALRLLLGMAEDEDRWALVRGWLVGALLPSAPTPALWCLGPQGSGKSTAARFVLSVIDPAADLGSNLGESARDDTVKARSRYVPTWDNVSTVSAATSDWLCRLVTGASDERRTLYAQEGMTAGAFRRTAIVTGIVLPPNLGSDALERLVVLPFARVPDEDRVPERRLRAQHEAQRGAILAAVLDDLVVVLAHLDEVPEHRSRPRMADYSDALHALDLGAGTDVEGAYLRTVDLGMREAAEDDPVTAAVVAIVRKHDGHLTCTAERLFQLLVDFAPDDRRQWWPTSARAVRSALDKSSEPLRHVGITIHYPPRTKTARLITLTLTERDDTGGGSPRD